MIRFCGKMKQTRARLDSFYWHRCCAVSHCNSFSLMQCVWCRFFKHSRRRYLFPQQQMMLYYACIHVRVCNRNSFECHWKYTSLCRSTGNAVISLTLPFFSNKIIIFIHSTDSALFSVFLAITHTLTKLKRLLTFDNFSVPVLRLAHHSHSSCKWKCLQPTETLFIFVFLFYFSLLCRRLMKEASWHGRLKQWRTVRTFKLHFIPIIMGSEGCGCPATRYLVHDVLYCQSEHRYFN